MPCSQTKPILVRALVCFTITSIAVGTGSLSHANDMLVDVCVDIVDWTDSKNRGCDWYEV